MACRDMMIWVGVSYPTIECDLDFEMGKACYCRHCRPPRGGDRCYVHEAEYRGCCRRVPNLVTWAVPGKTRVFLVHSAGREEGHQGTLFGYFLFERFEVLADPATFQKLQEPDWIPWSHKLFQDILKEVRAEYASRPIGRQDLPRLKKGVRARFERRRRELTQQVAKKEVKFWQPTDRPPDEPLEDFLEELLQGLLEELLKNLLEARIRDWHGDPGPIPWSENLYRDILREVERDRVPSSFEHQDLSRLERTVTAHFEDRREVFARQVEQGQVDFRQSIRRSLDVLLQELLDRFWKQLVENLLVEAIRDWVEGLLSGQDVQARILHCYCTAGEGERSCSPPNVGGYPELAHKRTKPGAIYVVDALTAQITDEFMDALYDEMEDPTAIGAEDIARKEEIFRRVVRQVHKRRKQSHYPVHDATEGLPVALRKEVVKRGELVLFPPPFPVIQRCPKASFLSYLRVDGDRLLAEVAGKLETKRDRLVKVPYCTGSETRTPLTKPQLQAYLACELAVNQSLAGDMLNVLCNKAAAEIANEGKFVLPNFGSFTLEDGEVEFSAYKALRDKLKTPEEEGS